MRKKLRLLFCLLLSCVMISQAQSLRFSGNVKDTTAGRELPNVILMAIKLSDSTLVGHTRTDNKGIFKPVTVPLDTYIVILSHPLFGDKTYVLAPTPSDTILNFRNVVLPPKTHELKEVEIIAYKESVYYKGDTLVFTADSFKTAPSASVEDLLKKLPGFRVDAAGKITVQGKQVDQVLVDGDEFFGGDPTIATRNLNASSIENVQVYDKKNDNAGDDANETLKVVNLKMKDDARKGYFGKASAASDFQNFYENDLLANRFRGNRKISVFGLLANTPKQAFNWRDTDKYGLTGEQPWSYDEESGTWTSNRDDRTGIPQTLKSGVYYSDRIAKETKLNTDYTFNQNSLNAGSETNTQYFLLDTSFSNRRVNNSVSGNSNHNFNLKIVHKFDSLTELTIAPKAKYNTTSRTSVQEDSFYSEEDSLTRVTTVTNRNRNEVQDANVHIKLSRNFKKKDRNLSVNYFPSYFSMTNTVNLNSDFRYYMPALPDSVINQRRIQQNNKLEHNASVNYTEPWTKKFKTEVNYSFIHNHTTSSQETYDQVTGSDIFNPVLSNNFDNTRLINRAGLKFIYDVKKYKFSIGSYFRNIQQENINLTTGQRLHLSADNILPNAVFVYRIRQGSNLSVNYSSSSQQPELRQMQPVIDNTDPNHISFGNPELKPTFRNNVNFNYYSYKGVSEVYFWSGGNFHSTANQISYATSYDSFGRATSMPVNLNGNFGGNVWMGGGHPVFNRLFKIFYNLNASHSNNVSLLNDVRNITKTSTFGPGITFEKSIEKFEFELSGNYDYTVPETNVSVLSVQPYYTYKVNGRVMVKLPKKFTVDADWNYTNNGNRTPGYNLNYFILNASVSKSFLKNENLIVGFSANDIFNQNINNNRIISANQIIDTKTQIIRRYFLLRLTYKFNSQNTQNDD